MNHITPSREEVLLLLNKWKAESTQVVILYSINQSDAKRAIIHVRGIIKAIENNPDVFHVEGPGKNFALVAFEGCEFRYTQPDLTMAFTEDVIDEVIAIIYQAGTFVSIYAIK